MKILFLGTMGTEGLNTSCVIDDSIAFDMGGGIFVRLRAHNLIPRYVILSHYHPDHFADVAELVLYNSFKACGPLTIVGNGVKKRVKTLCKVQDTFISKDTTLENIKDQIKNFGEFVLTARTLPHGDIVNNAYIIEKGGKKLGYTGDVCKSQELLNIIPLCDKWIIECTYEKSDIVSEWHLSKEQVEELAALYPGITFYAVHRRDSLPKSKCKNIIFPKDGEVIEI